MAFSSRLVDETWRINEVKLGPEGGLSYGVGDAAGLEHVKVVGPADRGRKGIEEIVDRAIDKRRRPLRALSAA
jgi:hypothetical protein